jgi:hypothetical protein
MSRYVHADARRTKCYKNASFQSATLRRVDCGCRPHRSQASHFIRVQDGTSTIDALPFYDMQWGGSFASFGRRKVRALHSTSQSLRHRHLARSGPRIATDFGFIPSQVAIRSSAKKFYIIDKIIALNTTDSEQLQSILSHARACYHSCMVLPPLPSSLTSSSSFSSPPSPFSSSPPSFSSSSSSQVRSSSDLTSSSFAPIVGCHQIELRRSVLIPSPLSLSSSTTLNPFSIHPLYSPAIPLSNRIS